MADVVLILNGQIVRTSTDMSNYKWDAVQSESELRTHGPLRDLRAFAREDYVEIDATDLLALEAHPLRISIQGFPAKCSFDVVTTPPGPPDPTTGSR